VLVACCNKNDVARRNLTIFRRPVHGGHLHARSANEDLINFGLIMRSLHVFFAGFEHINAATQGRDADKFCERGSTH
jgi:hypothetical protein